jgi:hypothetical protein
MCKIPFSKSKAALFFHHQLKKKNGFIGSSSIGGIDNWRIGIIY